MAGHSKWVNIKQRKGRQDKIRGKAFTKLGKEIMIAAKTGGGNIDFNPRLRLAIDKAKAANMAKDTIDIPVIPKIATIFLKVFFIFILIISIQIYLYFFVLFISLLEQIYNII